jgi:hypothetical protein
VLAAAALLVLLSILGSAGGGSAGPGAARRVGDTFPDIGRASATARGASALAAGAGIVGADAIRPAEQTFAVMVLHLERVAVAQASAERASDARARTRALRTQQRAATLALQRTGGGSASGKAAVSSPAALSSPPLVTAPAYSAAASGGGGSSSAGSGSSGCFPGNPGC